MTEMVRAEIYDIIRSLSNVRNEIKPEILYWLQKKFERILSLKPRYIDVLTLEECTMIRDFICSKHHACADCPLYDKLRRNTCLPQFMITPYDEKNLQEYICIVKKQIKERKENGTENS